MLLPDLDGSYWVISFHENTQHCLLSTERSYTNTGMLMNRIFLWRWGPRNITIESLNSVIRHAIKKRKVFPTDESVKKVVWLAIQSASQKWTMPLQDWRIAMSRFIIEFGDRLDGHFWERHLHRMMDRLEEQLFIRRWQYESYLAFCIMIRHISKSVTLNIIKVQCQIKSWLIQIKTYTFFYHW